MKKFIIIFIILLSSGLTQVASDHAYTGAVGMALTGAVVANTGNAESAFYNPGGLAEIRDTRIAAGSSKIIDVPYDYLSAVYPLRQFGTIGISVQQSRVVAGSVTLSKETDLGFSNGFYLQKDENSQLMAGYTIHMYRWSLGGSAGTAGDGSDGLPSASGSAAGVDIGIMAVLRGKHRVGAWLKNVNSPTIGENNSAQYLPQRMTIGAAYLPYKGLTTSLVFDRLLGVGKQVKAGIEYELTDIWTVRVGVQSNPNRMGTGFTIKYRDFSFNYALITHPVLPIIQQVSLGYVF